MLYLGYLLLRYVLIYNLEVPFNFHLIFLQINVIISTNKCAVKTVLYLTLAYFLRTPDNSNLVPTSLEGSSFRESTVFPFCAASLLFSLQLPTLSTTLC